VVGVTSLDDEDGEDEDQQTPVSETEIPTTQEVTSLEEEEEHTTQTCSTLTKVDVNVLTDARY
jgi:hypothetical protein